MKTTLVAVLTTAAIAGGAAEAQANKIKYNFSGSTFVEETRKAKKVTGSGYRGKRTISFKSNLKPGTILIKTNKRRLYYVLPGDKAVEYGIGVGREGFTWRGRKRISRKAEWPSWTPPKRMIERERKKGRILPEFMPGGPNNPLGARAMYLGSSIYRIHGTNQAHSIGLAVSSGCIRMLNEEVVDLYRRVRVGTPVIVE